MAADADLTGMLGELFGDYRDHRAAPSADRDLDRTLWSQLAELGLTDLTTPESRGGSGATWAEAAALLGEAAGAAAPVPLAEHDLLAGWLLEQAGIDPGEGLRTVCRPAPDGRATAVPWARDVDTVVGLVEEGESGASGAGQAGGPARCVVVSSPVSALEVEQSRNLAGFPSDTVTFGAEALAAGVEVDSGTALLLRHRGALARCAQSVGAMERVVEVVLTHVSDRTQFGRPVGRFQAVQHLVADIASEAALARAATDRAVAKVVTSGWDETASVFAVAVAKSVTGHAASVVVRNAHQAMGAIGTTVEHELHLLTKPILVWRSDFGSVHQWDDEIATMATAAGRDGLWDLLTTP